MAQAFNWLRRILHNIPDCLCYPGLLRLASSTSFTSSLSRIPRTEVAFTTFTTHWDLQYSRMCIYRHTTQKFLAGHTKFDRRSARHEDLYKRTI
ncbi:hypothetical protein ACN38_g9582 [Penicillium nordicum]|uniref:Uncharacterized protein n=1 Tax=Penicillium nordicum TaxID=229535 RepID=A0A0M9WCR3_9EURO|nr:hypothetical protein ACN38_g9582 [Penicillium nordicum]